MKHEITDPTSISICVAATGIDKQSWTAYKLASVFPVVACHVMLLMKFIYPAATSIHVLSPPKSSTAARISVDCTVSSVFSLESFSHFLGAEERLFSGRSVPYMEDQYHVWEGQNPHFRRVDSAGWHYSSCEQKKRPCKINGTDTTCNCEMPTSRHCMMTCDPLFERMRRIMDWSASRALIATKNATTKTLRCSSTLSDDRILKLVHLIRKARIKCSTWASNTTLEELHILKLKSLCKWWRHCQCVKPCLDSATILSYMYFHCRIDKCMRVCGYVRMAWFASEICIHDYPPVHHVQVWKAVNRTTNYGWTIARDGSYNNRQNPVQSHERYSVEILKQKWQRRHLSSFTPSFPSPRTFHLTLSCLASWSSHT